MTTESLVNAHLVRTLDKKETLATLRQWRFDSNHPEVADVLTDLIHEVESGELDG